MAEEDEALAEHGGFWDLIHEGQEASRARCARVQGLKVQRSEGRESWPLRGDFGP